MASHCEGQDSTLLRVPEDHERRNPLPYAPFSDPDADKFTGQAANGNRCRQKSWECVHEESYQEETQGILPTESGQDAARQGYGIHPLWGSRGTGYSPAHRRAGQVFRDAIVSLCRDSAAGAIRLYQILISPLFPSSCRFYPTCSEYAREAVLEHGVLRGTWLALRRLVRCRPFGPGGFDPVP